MSQFFKSSCLDFKQHGRSTHAVALGNGDGFTNIHGDLADARPYTTLLCKSADFSGRNSRKSGRWAISKGQKIWRRKRTTLHSNHRYDVGSLSKHQAERTLLNTQKTKTIVRSCFVYFSDKMSRSSAYGTGAKQ